MSISMLSLLAAPLFIIIAAIIVISLFLHFVPLGLWISAMAAGVSVGIVNLIGMRLRRRSVQDYPASGQSE